MTRTIVTAVVLLLGSGVTANAADGECAAGGGLQFVCGPQNAEDLVSVPETAWIIASAMADGAGFALIDARDKTWSQLPFTAGRVSRADRRTYAQCPGAPDPASLNTHGLDLRPGEDGHSTLYAVGHGEREAIEVFDVDASRGKPVLAWKGCVPMPEGLAANSVASFEDGSIVATVLLLPGKTFQDSLARKPTGAVYEWSPGATAFELVEGTELPGNNGIAVAADGSEIFVVSSGFQTIVAFSHSNPARELRSTRPLAFTPDNVHVGPDGRLLTAGMKNDVPACGGPPNPQMDLAQLSSCPRGFMAVSIDPQTMQYRIVAQGAANPQFSNATMVLMLGREFWIGTFSGNRVGYGMLD